MAVDAVEAADLMDVGRDALKVAAVVKLAESWGGGGVAGQFRRRWGCAQLVPAFVTVLCKQLWL